MNVQVKLHVEVIFCTLEMILVIFLFNLPVFLTKTKPKSVSNSRLTSSLTHYMLFFLTEIEELVSVELKGVQIKKTHATIILIKWKTDQLTEGHIVCITKTGTESF